MKKALLVASFGSTHLSALEKSIGATEKTLLDAFPEYTFNRAFTSRVVIKKLVERDALTVETPAQAAARLLTEVYAEILVQPLHLMAGIEYEMLLAQLEPYRNKFTRLHIGRPLLAGAADLDPLIDALSGVFDPFRVYLLMGHGSSHAVNRIYGDLDRAFKQRGFGNVFIGTLEDDPDLETLIPYLQKNGVEKVTLKPLMLVAGEHAQNDLAGEQDHSWKKRLLKAGFKVELDLRGLGEHEPVRQLFVAHARAALQNGAL
ncbi:MAG: sirohydrochlorin cobaltochelatase [Anaerolineae bacterium]|nr:sirohydrochlorin cobaltochelatase [Anaerolineae bacterium]